MPAFNTALTRDLDLPSALWLCLSPLDSVVGVGRGDEPRVLTPHDFDSARPEKQPGSGRRSWAATTAEEAGVSPVGRGRCAGTD